MISIKGPPPKVPAPITLKEKKKFIQYLAEPHEQFARAVHAATVFLNGETLNTHAEPGWEDVMSFDLDEIQAIIHHVTAVFAQHLPVHSGGPGLPGQPGIHPGNANNVGGGYASPGQAPGTPSLAAPGGAAGNDALTPSQPSSHPVPAPRPGPTRRAPLKSNFLADVVARKLGDTRKIVLESYIDPIVFAKWRENANVTNAEKPKIGKRESAEIGDSAKLGRSFDEYERALRDELLPATGEGSGSGGRGVSYSLARRNLAAFAETKMLKMMEKPEFKEAMMRVAAAKVAEIRQDQTVGYPALAGFRDGKPVYERRTTTREGMDAQAAATRTEASLKQEAKFIRQLRERELIEEGMGELTSATILTYERGVEALDDQTPSHPVPAPRLGPTRRAPLKSNFLVEKLHDHRTPPPEP